MPLAIPEDKKKRVRTQLTLAVPSEVITVRVNLPRRLVQSFSKNIREHGAINPPPNGRRGRRTHISPQMEQVLVSILMHSRSKKKTKIDHVGTLEFLTQSPSAYIDEQIYFLWDEFDIMISEQCIKCLLDVLIGVVKWYISAAFLRNFRLANGFSCKLELQNDGPFFPQTL
jgi:hypothetical protein